MFINPSKLDIHLRLICIFFCSCCSTECYLTNKEEDLFLVGITSKDEPRPFISRKEAPARGIKSVISKVNYVIRNLVLTIENVDEILRCNNPQETFWLYFHMVVIVISIKQNQLWRFFPETLVYTKTCKQNYH